MRLLLSVAVLIPAVACVPVIAATQAAIERLEAEILSKHANSPPTMIIEALGSPNTRMEREGIEYLTWESSKQSGTYVYGVGVVESYSCRATFQFQENKLVKVALLGTHGSDRSMCKKLVKPLLPASSGGNLAAKRAAARASAAVTQQTSPPREILTNEDIVKLTEAGLADSVIVAKIKGSVCKFDISTDALVALKREGVSDAVIQVVTEAMTK